MCFSTLQSSDGTNWAYSDGTPLTDELSAIMTDDTMIGDYDLDRDGEFTSCLAVGEHLDYDYDWIHAQCSFNRKYMCEFKIGKYEINVLNDNHVQTQ